MQIDWSQYITRLDACPDLHPALRDFKRKLSVLPPPDYRAVLEGTRHAKAESSRLFSRLSHREAALLGEIEALCQRMISRSHPIAELNEHLQVGIEVELGGFELAAFEGGSDNPRPVVFERATRVAQSEARTPTSKIPFVIWEAEGSNQGMTAADKRRRDSLLEYVGAPFSFSEADPRNQSQRECITILDELQRRPAYRNGPIPGYPEFMPISDLIEAYNQRVLERTNDRRFLVVENTSQGFRWYHARRGHPAAHTTYDQGNFDFPLRRVASGTTSDLFLPWDVVKSETRTLIRSPRDMFGGCVEKAQGIVRDFFSHGLSSGSRAKLTGVIALFVRAAAMREQRALSSMRGADQNFIYKNSFLLACKTPINDLLRLGFSQRTQRSIALTVTAQLDRLRERFVAECKALRNENPLLWMGLSRDDETESIAQMFENVFVPSVNPRYPGETIARYGRTVHWDVPLSDDMKTWPFCDSIRRADAIPVQLYVTELQDGRRELEPMIVLESRLGYADRLVGFAVRRHPSNASARERLRKANDLSQSHPDDYDSD